jgi:hypothetical protein
MRVVKQRINLSTLDEDFIIIEKLLKTLRKRIADVAESVRLAARHSDEGRNGSLKHRGRTGP